MAGNEKKKAKKTVLKDWKSSGEDYSVYDFVIGSIVTHPAKATNSNAYGGFFVKQAADYNSYPYLSAKHSRVQLKITPTVAAKFSQFFEQVYAVLNNDFSMFKVETILQEDIEHIQQSYSKHHNAESHPVNLDKVSIRVRQIILQDENGVDCAFTPLTSPAFQDRFELKMQEFLSNLAKDNITNGKDSHSERLVFNSAYLQVGGANPVNVGRPQFVGLLHNVYFLGAPETNTEDRVTMSFYYNGVNLTPNVALLQEYGKKLLNWRLKDGGMRTMHRVRDEKSMIRKIVFDVLHRVQLAHKNIAQSEIVGQPVSDGASSFIRGLMDSNQRTQEWVADFAKVMALKIARAKADQLLIVNINEKSAVSTLTEYIKECF